MTVINLTRLDITLIRENGSKTTIESSGIARVDSTEVTSYQPEIDGVPVIHQEFGDVSGLPPYKEGDWIIVSRMVTSACKDRKDLLVPAKLVRDDNGNIVGVRALETI